LETRVSAIVRGFIFSAFCAGHGVVRGEIAVLRVLRDLHDPGKMSARCQLAVCRRLIISPGDDPLCGGFRGLNKV
jgi:hypothetical protein